jgi:sugar-phosphatase
MTTIRCKAILLDLDGTLIDADAAAVQYWTAWAKSVGTDPEAVLQARQSGRRRDIIAAFRPGLSEAKLEEEVSRVREAALANIEHVVALPGAKRLLTELPAGRWAIVTSNDREVALGRLRAAGLPTPEVVVAAEDVAKGKPDPEGYLMAARLLGFSVSEVVVVDDSAVGIEAADAAGMRAIAIQRDANIMHSRKAVRASVNNLAYVTTQADNGDILLTISSGRAVFDEGVATEAAGQAGRQLL